MLYDEDPAYCKSSSALNSVVFISYVAGSLVFSFKLYRSSTICPIFTSSAGITAGNKFNKSVADKSTILFLTFSYS